VLLSGTPLELTGVFSADAHIRGNSSNTDNNYGSAQNVLVDGAPDAAALIQFDVSEIAPGSVVQSVSLTFNVTNPSPGTWEIYQVLRPWLESEVTFDFPTESTSWEQDGALGNTDRDPTVLGTLTATTTGQITIELNQAGVAVVQGWVDDPSSNHGLIIQDYAGSSDDLTFSSREVSNDALRPTFKVTYGGAEPGNLAPVVDAGLDQTILSSNATVSLDGTVTDDGLPEVPGILKTDWAVVSGPGTVTFSDRSAIDTTATFSAPGTYVLRLRAEDGELAAMDVVEITVLDADANLAPAVNAGPDQTVFLATGANLAGTISDDGIALQTPSASWTKISGPGNVVFGDAGSAATTATFSAAGTYVLELTSSDGIAAAADRVTIYVYDQGANTPPVVLAGEDQSILLNQSATLAGIVFDDSIPNPAAAPLTTTWVLISGPGNATFGNAASPSTTATFNVAGTYVLELRANDGAAWGTDQILVNVVAPPSNQAPVVDAGVDRTVLQSGTLNLDATVSDDGVAGPLTTAWSVVSGPGTVTFGSAGSVDTTATFGAAGTYVLRLTANDGQASVSDTVTVSVIAPSSGSSVVSFQDGVNGYAGTTDTKLRESGGDDDTNFGNTNNVRIDGNPDEGGLIRWDLSSIAPGTVVTDVTITVRVTNPTIHTFELYGLKRAWSESQATWNEASSGQLWQIGGAQGTADRDSTVLGVLTAAANGFATIQLNAAGIAWVQNWINNPSSNFGFAIQDYANSSNDEITFSSSEAAVVTDRPKLTLTLNQGAPQSTINLLPLTDQTMSHGQDVLTVNLPVTGATGAPIYAFEFTSTDSAKPLKPGDVVGSINGSTLTINPAAGFVGEFEVKVHVRDAHSDDVETFRVSVTNAAPVLGAIGDQTIYRDDSGANIALPGSDLDNDLLTYTVVVSAGGSRYQLDQAHGFTADQNLISNNYFLNARGYGEKYLRGNDGWYLLFSNGDLYRWGGSVPESTFVASLGAAVYLNPALLWNASAGTNVAASVNGSSLSLTPQSDFFGTFQVTVTASDGFATTSQTFTVNKNPLTQEQAQALATLQIQIPDLVARTENNLGVPSFLMNRDGYLTPAAAGDPVQITQDFLNAHRDLFGLTPLDTLEVLVTSTSVSLQSGITYVYLQQTHAGLAVYGGVVNAGLNGAGQVLVLGNSFAPDVAGSLNTLTPTITAQQAVQQAAQQLGVAITEPLTVVDSGDGPDQSVIFTGGGISRDNIPVGLMILPMERGESRLVWSMVINMTNSADWLHLMVDAQTGEILNITNWTAHASYNVFALPLGDPDDGPGLPGSQTVVTNPADPDASPFGWHDSNGIDGDDFNDTRGNNVFAQEDRDGDNAGGFRPSGGANNDYAFVFNPAIDPIQNQNVAIVNLFYWNNIVHDVLFHYGFDEASGNFQLVNYSNQGAENDPVQADAQDAFDFGVTNNANFATPPDGLSPRMQMYIFDLTNPFRDSDIDAEVIVHEYGHGVSNRLVGGPADAGALNGIQSGGMGEGWSDWFSLVFTAKDTDGQMDAYPVGNYVLGFPTTGPGIRRFPYSFDMTIDPLTYNDIDPNQIDVPVDFPEGADEVHNVGEVWASALWDMYWLLVERDGFNADLYNGTGGNNTALQLVIEGMKLTPASPTFLDARDGILAADAALFNGANTDLIWQAFARRGMGFSAQDGGGHNSTDVVEAFDVPTGGGSGPDVTLSLTGSPFDENGGTATVTATIAAASNQDIRVNLGFSGTATNQIDYTPTANFITIAAGQTSGSITLTGIDDNLVEGDETVIVDITGVIGGQEAGGQQQVTATIRDNDGVPRVLLEVIGSPFSENGGVATVRATLSNTTDQVVTINLAFAGTAFLGSDYTASGNVITINVGDSSGEITLTGIDDTFFEPTESVVTRITSIQNALPTFGNQEVTAYILDDDSIVHPPIPQVTLSISRNSFPENGGSAVITATLSNISFGSIIELGFSGSATFGADYSASSSFIIIPAGSLSSSITITGIDDLFIEPDETVVVDIVTAYNAVEAGGTQRVTATITSDDVVPAVTLGISGGTIDENGGVAVVTATLSSPAVQDTTIFVGFGGNATYNSTVGLSDYVYYTVDDVPGAPDIPNPARIFIPQGQTTGTLRIEAVNDPNDEPNESITVSITGAVGAVEMGNQVVSAIIIDDDPSRVNVGLNFTGTTYGDSGFFPPDTMGSVGPNHIVELINGRYAVYDKADGAPLFASTLDAFWTVAGATFTGVTFDPRIVYDLASQRWFATAVDNLGEGDANNFLVAVSVSSNPLDGWNGFAVDSDTDNAQWADFPTLGLDADGVYIAANMFPVADGAFALNILSIPKADLLLATPTVANATLLEDVNAAFNLTIQPAVDFGASDGRAALLSADTTQLHRANILGGGTNTATLSNVVNITTASTNNNPPSADQPGPKANIHTGDNRFQANVFEVGDSLWAVHNVTDPVTGNAAIRWYEIDETSNTILQTGLISDLLLDFHRPSIAANAFGDVVIGFSASGESQFVSSYAVVGTTTNGITTFGQPTLLKEGVSDYQQLDGSGRNRWGDYSATVIDPNDPFTFWTFQEIVTSTDSWGIQITQIQIDSGAVTLTMDGSPIAEDGGTATITATITQPQTQDVIVTLAFTGTASLFNGSTGDYTIFGQSTSNPPTIRIRAGETSGSILITGLSDDVYEGGDETIIVDIVSVTGGTAVIAGGAQSVSGVIVDSDVPALSTALFHSDPNYTITDHLVSTTVFVWYNPTQGQMSGPWAPLEGRPNWTGDVDFWKRQIKDMMDANIDVMYVIMFPPFETERTNLFQAAYELRAEGYDIPKIAPFFDTVITYDLTPHIDLATQAGKDDWVSYYIEFFDQYYSVNTDPFADNYILQIDGKVVLNNWHNQADQIANLDQLTREDVESRLINHFGANSIFANGIHMIGTALNQTAVSFVDEKIIQFEITDYFSQTTFNNITTAQVKPGYWDQNVRDPGSFLPRDGGQHYINAWTSANNSPNLVHVNVESWNEYDEGSGIYEADPGPPIVTGSNTNDDTWSSTDNPREYIDSTAAGARTFNDTPDYGAQILWHNLPASLAPGETTTVTVIVRNTGDLQWTSAAGFEFQQNAGDPIQFLSGPVGFDETAAEIAKYGGVFRGRPVVFEFDITAPTEAGTYITNWTMISGTFGPFGQLLEIPISVGSGPEVTLSVGPTSFSEDGGTTTVTATLSEAADDDVTVVLGFSGGAVLGVDYNASATTIVIPQGETSGSITLTGIDNSSIEGSKHLSVQILSVTNAVELGQQQVAATILNDDLDPLIAPWVSVSFNFTPIQENGGQATVTAIISQAQTTTTTVDLEFSGAATFGVDYTVTGGTIVGPNTVRVTIPANQSYVSITLTSQQDDTAEGNESINVSIVDVSGVSIPAPDGNDQASGLILDADLPGTISGVKFRDDNANGIRDGVGGAVPEITLAPIGAVILPRNDDGSTDAISLGFTLNFFGQNYTSFFINNNGNVTFGGPLAQFTAEGFPTDFGLPMIAPFWSDVDTRGFGSGEVHFTSGTSSRGNRFVQVDWPAVGYFSSHTDLLNTFTLYIEDDPQGDIVVFDYGTMQWTTGDASGGVGGFGAEGAQIGFDAGDGVNFLSLGRPRTPTEVAALSNQQFAFRLNEQGQVASEPGLGGVIIYVDGNTNGMFDDPIFTVTAGDGTWEFANLPPGDYIIREVVPAGYYQTAPPEGFFAVTLGPGQEISGLEFGNAPIIIPEVSLESSTIAISENGGTATITANLSRATTVDVTVELSLGGTADLNSDYSISTTTLFIAAGSTSASATITGIDDLDIESIERIIVAIDSITNGTQAPGNQPLTIYLVDDDIPGPATLFVEDAEQVEGNGTATYDFNQTPSYYTAGSRPDSLTTGDLNGDGYLDLIVVNSTGNSISVLLNNGNGTFGAATNFNVGTTPDSAVAADLDGDGDLDIAVTTSNSVSILFNNGSGGFGTPFGWAAGSDPSGITAGDFDNDGDIDLAVANSASGANSVTVLFNGGNGQFMQSSTIGVGVGPLQVKAADLDGDGDLDLVVANGGVGSSTVSVLRNNGLGVFSSTQFAAGIQPKSVTLGDFTGDGILDIAVANVGFNPNNGGNINTVSILAGAGNGTFFAPVSYAAGPSVRSLTSGDLDGDGDLDLVVTNDGLFDNRLTVLLNNGSGSFGLPETLSLDTGHLPYDVIAADLDNDGDLDIASANRFGTQGVDGVAVFRNNADPNVLLFHVFLTEFSNTTVTVDYRTVDGTARAGSDYVATSGRLVFAPGQIVHTVAVPIIGDVQPEPDETMFLVLSNPRNAGFSDSQGQGTIINDDGALPVVSLSTSNPTVSENGGTVTVTATLSAPVDHDVIVELEYTGSAFHTQDFLVTSTAAPIRIDGNFDDWHFNPSILFYSDPFGDPHDTDTNGENNTPVLVDHPDVDLLEFSVTHDDENLYFYFRAAGEIGRTQIEDLANGLAAGRYYIIVTIDADQNDATGYNLHEGGYYPTTGGYDLNAEIEYYNGTFNTGHYLNHGAFDDATRLVAFEEQSENGFDESIPYNSWQTQGPFNPGFLRYTQGFYPFYTQWVYKENDPNNGGNDSVTFVKDRGPIVLGIIQGARSTDGHEYEFVAPFKGFLVDENGNPIIDIGSILDLSFSLEASPELAPGGQWASDTADPVNGYELTHSSTRAVTTIIIPAGQTSASVTLTGLPDAEDEPVEFATISIANVIGALENGDQEVTIAVLDDGDTPLDAYIATPDPSFSYTLADTRIGAGYTAYILDMTSQTWRSADEVDPSVWKHWVTVFVPDTVTSSTALLFIDGGSFSAAPPAGLDAEALLYALNSNSVVVHVRTIPNQPTEFFGDGVDRHEDEIIAYTFDQFLNGEDEFWPLLLPMVKSSVAAMDAGQDFIFDLSAGAFSISDFVVTGASKRGWTTWLTAVVDPRVSAIIPMVIDLLNFPEQVPNHLAQYAGVTDMIIGGAAEAVHDYTDIDFFTKVMSGEADSLLAIVDPYLYLDRPAMAMPKYLVHGAGDEFFYPNSSQFYFHDLPGGDNYLRYVPNAGHGLNAAALLDMIDFYNALLAGADLPEYSWTVEDGGETIRLQTIDAPVSVTLWQATNLDNRDFRLPTFGPNFTSSVLTDQGGGEYVATLSPPATGATAFFIEMVYSVNGTDIAFTTDVSVIPGLAAPLMSSPQPSGSTQQSSASGSGSTSTAPYIPVLFLGSSGGGFQGLFSSEESLAVPADEPPAESSLADPAGAESTSSDDTESEELVAVGDTSGGDTEELDLFFSAISNGLSLDLNF